MLSKKYYIMIAEGIRESDVGPVSRKRVAESLAKSFAQDNPNFDSYLFVRECVGYETGRKGSEKKSSLRKGW